MTTRFEWDPDKAVGNLRKHGVSFETALRVFADPLALMEQDRIEDGERRWRTLGRVEGWLLLLVAHTLVDEDGDEVIRRRDALSPGKDDAMSKPIVRSVIDLGNLPPLTAAQEAELATLRALGDAAVDTSDIAPLPETFWTNAVRNPLYRPTKTSTTVRIDSDVLAWLRAEGKGYQSRINAILRREMLTSLKS